MDMWGERERKRRERWIDIETQTDGQTVTQRQTERHRVKAVDVDPPLLQQRHQAPHVPRSRRRVERRLRASSRPDHSRNQNAAVRRRGKRRAVRSSRADRMLSRSDRARGGAGSALPDCGRDR